MSNLIFTEKYRDFVSYIVENHRDFREKYNEALDEYKITFRFRYKNFPFPKLTESELPFWIVEDGVRKRLFNSDLKYLKIGQSLIFPRAATLTLFLRLHYTDVFVHGVGGGNYEWVNDRIIERFFKKTVIPYGVVSGTFLLDNYPYRNYPFFMADPDLIKERFKDYMSFVGGNIAE